MLTDYNIYAKTGGPMKAIQETVTVKVTDGVLNVLFLKGATDLPKVSAIEVIGDKSNADVPALIFPNPAEDYLTASLPGSGGQCYGNFSCCHQWQAPAEEWAPGNGGKPN